MQDYYDKKNVLAVRRSLVLELKAQGFTDFKIGQVLNISEYQVKKLRKELYPLVGEETAGKRGPTTNR